MVDAKVPSIDHDGEGLRILLIEDNPGDIIIVRERLKVSGAKFSITNASGLNEAITLLSNGQYDIILLDLGLPDSYGIDTLKVFLNQEVSLPVVVMTGLDDEDIALAALREGAQDYLVKTRLSSESILRSIKYSIERKKLENLQKKISRQLSILSTTTASLFEGDDIPSIYSAICDSIRHLVTGSYVCSVEFEESGSFYFTNAEQFKPWEKEITLLSGMNNLASDLNDQKKFLSVLFMDGLLHFLPGGIFEIIGGKIPAENCSRFARITGINYTYVIGFRRNESYYGGILIFAMQKIEDDDVKYIENLCSQASLGIHRRLTEQELVKSESNYQKLAGELEEKVKERTHELEIANNQLRKSESQLKELNATKDKFFNIVAHDLKNPFTSLLGATELLFNNIQNMDREKIKKLAQILNDSAKSGYAILLNLLDWSRSQTGNIKINLQKLNLTRVIEDNIADLYLNTLDKQITIESELKENIIIVGDKNMINTVLRNLLSNAVKFTPRGGKVQIKCELTDIEVIIRVIDNGIGISSEDIGKLFRIDSKFTRPGTDKEVGTGLGLKLSKEFVEKLGGRIWVRSTEAAGSEFIFSIPLQASPVKNK